MVAVSCSENPCSPTSQKKIAHVAAFSAGGRPPGGALGGDSRQRNEFVNFGAKTRRRKRFFMKFDHLHVHGCTHENLGPIQTFSTAHGSS